MTWWQYLILANVYLLLFYGFYAVLLRKETFFQLNRFYLVTTSILSFLVPLIQSDWARRLFITQQIKQKIYQLDPVMISHFKPEPDQHFTIGQYLAVIYLSGIVILSLRLLAQLLVLRRKLKNQDTDAAYSFFNTIRLSSSIAEKNVILKHEEVHAQQWHSADVLLMEAIMIVNWFNPAVYLYRNAIKHIHEFIADRTAIKSGTTKQEYALLLLSETFKAPAHQLVNPFFNHSLLKQRIVMLQKDNSHRTALLKYGLSAPLFALMLVLTSATTNTSRVIRIINKKAEQVLQVTATTPGLEQAYQSITTTADNNLSTTVKAEVKDFEPQAKPQPQITIKQDTGAVFTAAEQPARYPGGFSEFSQYLSNNFRLPSAANGNIPERIYLGFIVEKDGSLSNISVLKDSTPALLQEAVRVLSGSVKWIPAKQNGLLVRSRYTVPVEFGRSETASRVLPDSGQHVKVNTVQTFSYSYTTPNASFTTTQADSSKKITQVRIITGTSVITPAKSQTLLHPQYYINGEEASIEAVQKLDVKRIEKIMVFKRGEAKAPGDVNENGIVQITTKK